MLKGVLLLLQHLGIYLILLYGDLVFDDGDHLIEVFVVGMGFIVYLGASL
jgi:hypothetical protein